MNDLQNAIWSIAKAVLETCELEGLQCFAEGGTAIGAIRHQGFIPWDDDFDLLMPIEDYDSFLEVAPSKLPPYLRVVTHTNTPGFPHDFAKVVDIRTTIVEPGLEGTPQAYSGVWVDVFPLSALPDCAAKRRRHIFKCRMYTFLALARNRPLKAMGSPKRKALWIAAVPLRILPSDFFNKKLDTRTRSFNYGSSNYVGYYWSGNIPGDGFPYAWFDGTVMFPFEDFEIKLPVGYDAWLKEEYGDYLTVPPPAKRYSHNYSFDLDHPYCEYQKGLRSF